jgi:hypothetical protein
MTDDTLRQECEAQLFYLSQLSRTDSPVDALMAFARAQQAKGLREAAEIANRLGNDDARNIIMLKATAREGATT